MQLGDREGAGYLRSATVDQWATFISSSFPACRDFATFTYSDDAARRCSVFTAESAQRDFRNFLRVAGWRGSYFCAVEDHKDRNIPHLHALMQGSEVRRRLWGEWFASRGRCSIQPVKDEERVRLYVAKYVLKDDDGTRTFWRT